jgi:transposase
VLFWQLLTREQDYAFGRPSLTSHKLRRLELMAGHPPRRGPALGLDRQQGASRRHERELSEQVEQAYRRLVADWQQSRRKVRARHRDAHPERHQLRARQGQVPDPAL